MCTLAPELLRQEWAGNQVEEKVRVMRYFSRHSFRQKLLTKFIFNLVDEVWIRRTKIEQQRHDRKIVSVLVVDYPPTYVMDVRFVCLGKRCGSQDDVQHFDRDALRH